MRRGSFTIERKVFVVCEPIYNKLAEDFAKWDMEGRAQDLVCLSFPWVGEAHDEIVLDSELSWNPRRAWERCFVLLVCVVWVKHCQITEILPSLSKFSACHCQAVSFSLLWIVFAV